MARQETTEDGQSYSSHKISLIREMSTRAGNVLNKDEDFVNILFEIVKDRHSDDDRKFVLKRSGTTSYIPSVDNSEVRGQFYWIDSSKFFYAVGRDVYIYNTVSGVSTTLSNVFTTTTGDVGFTEYLYDDNTVVVIATDGTTLVQISNSNVVTPCTDPDLPIHQPYPVFTDGYLLLVKKDTSDIYNSDLNNPLSWTPGDFISAEMSPDLLLRIGKVNNYVIAMGTESVEYFWDAGNPTGSPFSRNDSPIKVNTYLGGLSMYGNNVFYIGKNSSGQPSVFMLQDFKLEELASPSIIRFLSLVTENTSTWRTNVVAMQGHTLLILSAGIRNYVYDLDEKLWGRFSYQDTERFNIKYATRITTNTSSYTVFSFKDSNSQIFRFDDTIMQDAGVNYSCQVVTEQSNFGTLNRKTMSRWSLYADRTPADTNLEVYWTDDDFQTYHGPRLVNLNQDLQSCYILGSFRQRAFKLRYTGPYIMRLQAIEVDINKGIS